MNRVADALLEKYGRNGPRYTSYPPAPLWHDKVGAADLERQLAEIGRASNGSAANTANAAKSTAATEADAELYVHVPFCEQLCTFCGCHTFITRKREPVDHFLATLELECDAVARAAGRKLTIGGLHFGGGTPTHLDVGQWTRLLDVLEKRFDFSACTERSLEVHPHVTKREQVDFLSSRGFTRLSMGVQDLSPEVQTAIHRFQTHDETKALVEHARARGFTSVNVDLIYGLPKQTLAGFERTIEQVVAMGVDRLAVYGYAHVPWLKRHQRAIPDASLPSPQLRRDLYELALARLESHGFASIGFDHFARPTDELFTAQRDGTLTRTFMGFTVRHARNLIGLGPSSIGELGPLYAQNEGSLEGWSSAVESRGLATKRGFLLTSEDALRRDVVRALLCHLRVDGSAIGAAHGVDFATHFAPELERMRPMVADGLVELKLVEGAGASIVLTDTGRYLARNVAMLFDQHLDETPTSSTAEPHRDAAGATSSSPPRPRYSQTV
jgi:oxygen-independent coproporphyrinogen-3 oxidase